MNCKECGHKIEKELMPIVTIDKTEYELKQHDNGKLLSEIKIPKGWRLLKPWEAQRLWDLGHLRDNWIFVKQTNKEEEKKGNVARFGADSDLAYLYSSRSPSNLCSNLGVIFARDLK